MTRTVTPTRLIALVAALTLIVGACSSGGGTRVASLSATSVPSGVDDDGSDEAATADDDEAILAFAACMRDQGLEDFEDPEIGADGSVQFGFRDLAAAGDIDRETIQSAMGACRDHLDGLAIGPGAVDRTEVEDQLYEFAACMRDNGYDMPDPDVTSTPGQGGGGPFGEIDPDDPGFQSALETCDEVFGGNLRFGGPGGPRSGGNG